MKNLKTGGIIFNYNFIFKQILFLPFSASENSLPLPLLPSFLLVELLFLWFIKTIDHKLWFMATVIRRA